jgi:hypothetical protein
VLSALVSGASAVEVSDAEVSAGEVEDALPRTSGAVCLPDWIRSLSGPVVFSCVVFAAACVLVPALSWAAVAIAEPPRASAASAAVTPVIVFSRLGMMMLLGWGS